MTQFRPDTSFPYLKVAREHGVEYCAVLAISDALDILRPVPSEHWVLAPWQADVWHAWCKERDRRAAVR